MRQKENDQNHKKEYTLDVDNKPNGKSQLDPNSLFSLRL